MKNCTVNDSGGGGGMSSRVPVTNVVASAFHGIGINLAADDNQVMNSVVMTRSVSDRCEAADIEPYLDALTEPPPREIGPRPASRRGPDG